MPLAAWSQLTSEDIQAPESEAPPCAGIGGLHPALPSPISGLENAGQRSWP